MNAYASAFSVSHWGRVVDRIDAEFRRASKALKDASRDATPRRKTA